MTSCNSKAHTVNADIQVRVFFDSNANSKQRKMSTWNVQKKQPSLKEVNNIYAEIFIVHYPMQ